MTNDLLTKATALLEAQHWPSEQLTDADYGAYAAGFQCARDEAAEIITGYQDLVRRMADTLELAGKALDDCMASHAPGQDFAETVKISSKRQRIIASQESISKILEEAKAALPLESHTLIHP